MKELHFRPWRPTASPRRQFCCRCSESVFGSILCGWGERETSALIVMNKICLALLRLKTTLHFTKCLGIILRRFASPRRKSSSRCSESVFGSFSCGWGKREPSVLTVKNTICSAPSEVQNNPLLPQGLDDLIGGKSGMRQGAKVVFCSRGSGAEKGQAIQRELQDSGCPGDAYYQVCNVRNEEDIKNLILITLERYRCLDCLVNNAGLANPENLDDVSAEDFRSLMEINLVGSFLASKYALPYLRKTSGNIINIASISGVIGLKYSVSYATSKGALLAMTKALAIDESKYRVRVNSISPGPIWTPMTEKVVNWFPNLEAGIQEIKNFQLLGRFGTPEEVALAALYLAADGTFCTGTNLLLSGGAELGFAKKNQVDPEPDPSESCKKAWE